VEEFTIIKFLDAGVKHFDKSGKFCLACLTGDYERLVIWGSEGNTNNLNAVSGKAIPFVILLTQKGSQQLSMVMYIGWMKMLRLEL